MLTPEAFNDFLVWTLTHNVTTAVAGSMLAAAFNANLRDRHSLQAQAAPETLTKSSFAKSYDTAQMSRDTSHGRAGPSTDVLLRRRAAKNKRDREKLAAKRAERRAAEAAGAATVSYDVSRDISPESYDSAVSEGGVVRQSRAVVRLQSSLSLSKNPDLNLKRERIGGPGERGRRVPLPAGWQPDEATTALAAERLGDAAACCIAKFRDHYADGEEVRTLKGWHGAARKWIRNERILGPQRALPLMRDMPAAAAAERQAPADPAWQPVYARLAAELGETVAYSWFRDCRLAIEGDTAIVSAATKFVAHHLTSNYEGPVLRAIAAVTRVRFVGRGAVGKLPAAQSEATGPPIVQTG